MARSVTLCVVCVGRAEPKACQEDTFPGLLGLVYSYLETLDVEESELKRIHEYLDLVKRRADGMWALVCWACVQVLSCP